MAKECIYKQCIIFYCCMQLKMILICLAILQVNVRLGQPRQGSCWSTSPTQVHTWPLYSRLSWGGLEYTEPSPQETKPGTHLLFVSRGWKFLEVGVQLDPLFRSQCWNHGVHWAASSPYLSVASEPLPRSLSICRLQQPAVFSTRPSVPRSPWHFLFCSLFLNTPACLLIQSQ